jgi:hypothetical protein
MSTTTRRAITLDGGPGMPYIVAECNATGWNAYHVPRINADMLRDYLTRSLAADPNGQWDLVQIMDDDEGRGFIFHDCATAGCDLGNGEPDHDHDGDDFIATDADGYAWVDGWTWTTALDEDFEPVTVD